MCLCCKKEIPEIKPGKLYEEIRPTLRAFDPVFFRGSDFVSNTISTLEKFHDRYARAGDFTHVGMIVTSEILQHDLVLPGKFYVWESTMGGKLGGDVYNIYGKTVLGVQLRDFDELIISYDKSNVTHIAVGNLINNPIDHRPIEELKQQFTQYFNEIDGRMYNLNLFSLLSALCPPLRWARKKIEKICHTESWLFCSELVAVIYVKLGIYPGTINPENVVPRDIAFPEADTDAMPRILNGEVKYVTTPIHYDPIKSNQQ